MPKPSRSPAHPCVKYIIPARNVTNLLRSPRSGRLTQLPQTTLKQFSDSSRQFAAYLAAGYNRNPAHVVQTYLRTHSLTGGHVSFENKMYVRIQSWVGDFLKKEYRVPS